MKFSALAVAAILSQIVRADDDDGWVTYTKKLTTTTVSVTKYAGTSTFLSGSQFTTQTVTVSNGDAVYVEIVTAHAYAGSTNDTTTNGTTNGTTSAGTSSSSASTSSSDSTESSANAAKALGISAGALAVGLVALL
jgi:hypothetical protein